jgi:hypothetical protein
MVYRGIYRDGIIIPDDAAGLKNGEEVHFFAAARSVSGSRRSDSRRSPRSTSPTAVTAALWEALAAKRLTKKQRLAAAAAACGSWSNRADMKGKSSARIAADLRKRASRRGPHA